MGQPKAGEGAGRGSHSERFKRREAGGEPDNTPGLR
jgi:hypothetical protein